MNWYFNCQLFISLVIAHKVLMRQFLHNFLCETDYSAVLLTPLSNETRCKLFFVLAMLFPSNKYVKPGLPGEMRNCFLWWACRWINTRMMLFHDVGTHAQAWPVIGGTLKYSEVWYFCRDPARIVLSRGKETMLRRLSVSIRHREKCRPTTSESLTPTRRKRTHSLPESTLRYR